MKNRKLQFESLENRRLLATIPVTNTNDSGSGSLRAAIMSANQFTNDDQIVFDFSVNTVIALNTPLPTITSPLTIGSLSTSIIVQIEPGSGFGSSGVGLNYTTGSAGNSSVIHLSITGFPTGGILVDGSGSLQVLASRIGIAADNSILGNGGYGIEFNTTATTLNKVEDTFVSGNTGYGIKILSTSNVDLDTNFIGVDTNGTTAVANGSGGIDIEHSANYTVQNGLISGNTGNGIRGLDPTGNSDISDIAIGTDASVETALGNTGNGIEIDSDSSGTDTAETDINGNVIGGNGNGILLSGTHVSTVVIQSNYIGIDESATTPIGNLANGIEISSGAHDNIIDDNNIIAYNAGAGVAVPDGGTGNTISQNSIFKNTGIGIDLGTTGATANDAYDADTGPNNLQNTPVVVIAQQLSDLSTVEIKFYIETVASQNVTVELFSSDGTSEGTTFITSVTFTVDGSGLDALSVEESIAPNKYITATATVNGSTSEFSVATQVAHYHVTGDVNLNGFLGVSDVSAMEVALTDIGDYEIAHSLTAADMEVVADVNRDGLINNADLQSLLDVLRGQTLPLIGDLDSSGVVNGADLAILASHWRSSGTAAQGDLNGDGVIDTNDLAILTLNLA